jgi:hypothetical protein
VEEEVRALAAAIELLRRQMADLPLAIIDNLSRTRQGQTNAAGEPVGGGTGAGRGRGAADRMGTAVGALALSFAKLLGPLAALHTFLSASTSGFSVFNKAINLFAAVLAPVLLPAFFLLAVALASVSEVLFTRLAPAMETFFNVMISTGIPIITRFIDMIAVAADALGKLAAAPGVIASMGGASTNPGMLSATGGIAGLLFAGGAGAGGAAAPAGAGGADVAAGRPGAGGGSPVGRAIKDTLAELRLSMGGQASVGSVAGVYTKAQMASFQSPFERRILAIGEEVVRMMARATGERVPGTGVGTDRAPGGAPERGGVGGGLAGGFFGGLFGGRR